MILFCGICRKNQKNNMLLFLDLVSKLHIKSREPFSVFNHCVDKRKREKKTLCLEMVLWNVWLPLFGSPSWVALTVLLRLDCACNTVFAGLRPDLVRARHRWVNTQMKSAFEERGRERRERLLLWPQVSIFQGCLSSPAKVICSALFLGQT